MKKGPTKKFKKQLEYIHKNYKPEFLSISQLNFYEHLNDKPIPEIRFIVAAYDPIHFMDDFIEKFSKIFMTGSAKPFKWAKLPKKSITPEIRKIKSKKARRDKIIARRFQKKYERMLKRDSKRK